MKKDVCHICRIAIAICWAITLGMGCTNQHELNDLLLILDRSILNKQDYVDIRQRRIDSLKIELYKHDSASDKFKISKNIYDDFFEFQNDSAMNYALRMSKYACQIKDSSNIYRSLASINTIRLLSSMGQFKEASDLLDRIPVNELPDNVKATYFLTRSVNYALLRDNTVSPDYKETYHTMSQICQDSALYFTKQNPGSVILATKLLDQNNPEAALASLKKEYDSLYVMSRRAGTLAYNIAECYLVLQDQPNYTKYLLLSAIADLRNGVRSYISLQKLAILMFEQGDIDRAYNYMKCALSDAISCNAKIRANEASEMFMAIDELHQYKIQKQHRSIKSVLIILTVLFILLVVSVSVIAAQYKKLMSIKQKLLDANQVKDGYLGLFIKEYASHLLKLNTYRVKSKKVINSGNLAEIEEFLDKALNANEDLKEFYQKFDSTVLHVFPTFIEEFNNLMNNPDIQSNQHDQLTPEQRIAAFIRLGINESDKIALFLRYSTRTVYNYRSHMRTKAKQPGNLIEDIMKIGLN